MASNYFLLLPLFTILTFNPIEGADEKCINVPLINNFDVEKVTGPWYVQEIGDNDEGTKKCILYDFISDKKKSGTTLTGLRIFNEPNSSTISKVEAFKAHQINNTSAYMVEWKGGNDIRKGYGIGTDYKSWGVYYVCQPEQADKGILFIATREKIPSATDLENARKSARKLGFPMTKPYLKRIDQSQCNY